MSTAFRFMTAQDIRFGRGVVVQTLPEMRKFGDKLAVIHGKNAQRADWFVDALHAQGADIVRIRIPAEPDIALIERAVLDAKQAGAKAVMAIGGGSVIDAGKAIAALVPAERPVMDHLEVVGRGLPLDRDPLPFVAIPTTSGTGAEVTKNAVLSVPQALRKVSLRDSRMLPDLALVDPSLTDNLPKSITLASGLDAVTQVIEPYLSCKANWLTDSLCRDAIPRGLAALSCLMNGEEKAARDALAWTSLCGGLALVNSGLGAVHGLAGVLGGVTGAAHGAICGTLLPHVMAMNEAMLSRSSEKNDMLERFAEVRVWIADVLGNSKEEAFSTLASWSQEQGLLNLRELGLEESQINHVADDALSSSSMKGNPIALSVDALEEVLCRAM